MRWLIASILLTACAAPEPVRIARAIELHTVSGSGEPLAGVRAWLDGAQLGETQSDGLLRATLRGRARQRMRLSWACPAAYEPPTGERDLVLEPPTAERAERAEHTEPPLKLEARCKALEIEAALVVRASGAPREGLPIRVRNEVVARTDPDGIAHVLLRARRGSALTVALDTSAHPRLVPENPIETFQLGDGDTILLVDRALSTPPVKAKRLGKKQALPDKPVRIE